MGSGSGVMEPSQDVARREEPMDDDQVRVLAALQAAAVGRQPVNPSTIARRARMRTIDTYGPLRKLVQAGMVTAHGNGAWTKYLPARMPSPPWDR